MPDERSAESGPGDAPAATTSADADRAAADGGAKGAPDQHGGGTRGVGTAGVAALTLGALGVVFGDIGTSPLYALQTVFASEGIAADEAHVYGIISLVVWAITIIVSVKYVTFIMRADNEGEGDIMALIAPGTAVCLTAGIGVMPLALRENVDHNHVVHEAVVVVSVETRKVPHVHRSDRVVIDDLGYRDDGIMHVSARYGFQDEHNVPDALRQAAEQGLESTSTSTTPPTSFPRSRSFAATHPA